MPSGVLAAARALSMLLDSASSSFFAVSAFIFLSFKRLARDTFVSLAIESAVSKRVFRLETSPPSSATLIIAELRTFVSFFLVTLEMRLFAARAFIALKADT